MGVLGLPVPGPTEAVKAATGLFAAIDQSVALVPRLVRLLDRLEQLADRADGVIGQVEKVVGDAASTVGQVEKVVGAAETTVGRVDTVVTDAASTVRRTDGVVDSAAATVRKATSTVDDATELTDRIVRTTSDEELAAVVKLIDTLPALVDTLRSDVLPVMSTLGTVAPDLRDLLDIASQLNGVLTSVPGLGRLRRRVEKAQAEDDQGARYTADEAPPSSPVRDPEDP